MVPSVMVAATKAARSLFMRSPQTFINYKYHSWIKARCTVTGKRPTITTRPMAQPLTLSLRQGLALAGICAAGMVLAWGPGDSTEARATAVILLAIGLWATGWLPEWLTALIFFTLCMVAKVAPPSDVFAGFSSSATWLVLSGIVIGAAMRHTGLGDRLAGSLAPAIGTSFPKAILAVVLFSVVMMFTMPSAMGRVVLMLPILLSLTRRLGYADGTRGQVGIVLAGLFATYLPATSVLPANVPNNVFVGTVEAVLGHAPTYGQYLFLHFPILGLVKIAVLIPLFILFYRDTPRPGPPAASKASTVASRGEIHLAVLLLAAVALWATDAWHGISAAWIGMIVAVWCLFPACGLMKDKPFQSLGFEPVFYVAGIVGMGAVANHSGLGNRIAEGLLSILPLVPDSPCYTFYVLSTLSTLVGLFVTLPGVPAVMTPMVPALAQATHWSPEIVAMTQVVGFSTVLLPYQAAPLVVAIHAGGLPIRDVTRLCLIIAAITIVLLWPLDYLWWIFLGVIG